LYTFNLTGGEHVQNNPITGKVEHFKRGDKVQSFTDLSKELLNKFEKLTYEEVDDEEA
jgi:hypothetical protein